MLRCRPGSGRHRRRRRTAADRSAVERRNRRRSAGLRVGGGGRGIERISILAPSRLATRFWYFFYFGASCTTAQTPPSATSDLKIRRIFFGQDIPGMSILSALCCRRHSVKKSHCSSPSSTIFDEMDRHRFLLCRAWRGKLQ